MTEHLPQRFKHRPKPHGRWFYGCCYYLLAFDVWVMTGWKVGGEIEHRLFDSDPGDVIDGLRAAQFVWIDKEMEWRNKNEQPQNNSTQHPHAGQPGNI